MSKEKMTLQEVFAELKKGGINYSFTAIMPTGGHVYEFHAQPPTQEAANILMGANLFNTCQHLLQCGNDENSVRALINDLVNYSIKEYKAHGALANQIPKS